MFTFKTSEVEPNLIILLFHNGVKKFLFCIYFWFAAIDVCMSFFPHSFLGKSKINKSSIEDICKELCAVICYLSVMNRFLLLPHSLPVLFLIDHNANGRPLY